MGDLQFVTVIPLGGLPLVTDYSHLSTQDLNQLIHDLSLESARTYHTGFLDELVRVSEEMGLYAPPSPVEAIPHERETRLASLDTTGADNQRKGLREAPRETFTPFRLEDYLKTDEDWDRYAEALAGELNRNTPLPPK
jgi:hypothetical protein